MRDLNNHVLEIRSGKKAAKGLFPDKQLADYPGRDGTECTEATIREMIRSLVN